MNWDWFSFFIGMLVMFILDVITNIIMIFIRKREAELKELLEDE